MLQVSIYFPEQKHSRYGVLRAVVKDTTNENNSTTRGQMVFLDSDGRVANNIATRLNRGNPMTDGKWHMVTVTTQPDRSTGFLLYLDGFAVGEMGRGTYTGKEARFIQSQQVVCCRVLIVQAELGTKHLHQQQYSFVVSTGWC